MGIVTAAVALAAGYLIGRLRPWCRLGDWAIEQVCFTGTWGPAPVRDPDWVANRTRTDRGGTA